MAHKRPHFGWFICLFVFSIPLFFGLFFGLNYKEILRNGWPLTTCTINTAVLNNRYCCYSDCGTSCTNAAANTQQCSDMINQVNSNYSPSTCAANSSTCPPQIGSTCDEGYHCCGTCCSTCSSCHTSCSGSGSSHHCSQSCSYYSCNCYCCSSVSHRACTLRCPTCYSVQLTVTYTPHKGSIQSNVPYTQEFGQSQDQAQNFLASHPPNSQSKCYYNPKNLSEIALDVSFTTWKWVITAIFGMFPVLCFLLFTGFYFCYRPLRGYITRRRGNGDSNKGKKDTVMPSREPPAPSKEYPEDEAEKSAKENTGSSPPYVQEEKRVENE